MGTSDGSGESVHAISLETALAAWPARPAARRPLEVEAMRLGQEPIEDGVGDRGVADPAVPVIDGKLVGDDRGALAGPVVDDLEQIGAGRGVDAAGAPVVEDQDVGAGEFGQPLAKRAARVQDAQLLGQTRHAQVEGAMATSAGVLAQGARQPGLADAGRSGHIVPANSNLSF